MLSITDERVTVTDIKVQLKSDGYSYACTASSYMKIKQAKEIFLNSYTFPSAKSCLLWVGSSTRYGTSTTPNGSNTIGEKMMHVLMWMIKISRISRMLCLYYQSEEEESLTYDSVAFPAKAKDILG